MGRADPGKHAVPIQLPAQGLLRHIVQLRPGQHLSAPEQSCLGGNGFGGGRVIPGNHHRADLGAAAPANGFLCLLPHRILHAGKAQKGQTVFCGGQAVTVLFRQRQHPERSAGQQLRLGGEGLAHGRGHGLGSAVLHVKGAAGQKHIRRPLAEGSAAAAGACQYGHAPGIAVKGLLLHSFPAGQTPGCDPCLGCGNQQGDFRGIPLHLPVSGGGNGTTLPAADLPIGTDGSIAAQHSAPEQGSQIRLCRRVADLLAKPDLSGDPVAGATHLVQLPPCEQPGDGHPVLGDGAGFIRTDHGGTAQGLHGVEPVHQGVCPEHPVHRQGKGDGDGGRQSLGNGGNGNGDAGQEHIKHRLSPQHACPEHDEAHRKADDRNGFPQLPQTLLEGGSAGLDLAQHGGDLPHLGGCTGGDHHCLPGALGDAGAGIQQGILARCVVRIFRCAGMLPHGHGFPGQHGFLCKQPPTPEDPAVRRHSVPCLHPDHVSVHQLRRRTGGKGPVPEYPGGRGSHSAEGFQGALRAVFLHKAQHCVEQHDQNDGHSVRDLPQQGGDHRCRQQDQHHHIPELSEKNRKRPFSLRRRQPVFPLLGKTLLRLLLRQPDLHTASRSC